MRSAFALLVVAIGVSACGTSASTTTSDGDPDATTTTTSSSSPDSQPSSNLPALGEDEALLTVKVEGGFVPVDFLLTAGPSYVVTGDGRMIWQAPVPAIYPAPANPGYLERELTDEELDKLARLISDAGLPDVRDEHNVDASATVADAPDTVFLYRDESGIHRFAVYALGIANTENRDVQALQALLAALDNLAFTGEGTPHQPDRVQVYVSDGGFTDPQFANELPWPLATDPREFPPSPFGLPCGVVDGADAATLLAALGEANQATSWDVDGELVFLPMRPLLPGENGCDT